MKAKLIGAIGLVATFTVAILVGLFGVTNGANSTAEISKDIGAMFPKGKVEVNYASFKPEIARSQALSIAKNALRLGYNLDPDSFPAYATVAILNGEVQNPTVPIAVNRPVWIVVIKQLPFQPLGPGVNINSTSQLNVAIDATTGEIIHEVLSGKLPLAPN